MANLLHWITRRTLRFGGNRRAADGDDYVDFERIDASRLGVNEFRLSESMRPNGAATPDFANTLPAYTQQPEPGPSGVQWRRAA